LIPTLNFAKLNNETSQAVAPKLEVIEEGEHEEKQDKKTSIFVSE